MPRVAARVTASVETGCTAGDDRGCVALTVLMSDGPLPGRSIVVVDSAIRGGSAFDVGDDVVLVWSGAPAILAGRDPLAVALVGCFAIMFGVLYCVAPTHTCPPPGSSARPCGSAATTSQRGVNTLVLAYAGAALPLLLFSVARRGSATR